MQRRSHHDQLRTLSAALAADEPIPAGRLLGLPELDDGDVWVDSAAAAVLLHVSPSTLTSWIARRGPKAQPLPQPTRVLYRLYWRRSDLTSWSARRPG